MHIKRILITLILIGTQLLQATYTLDVSYRKKSKIDRMPKAIVQDMSKIPQNPSYYAKQIKKVSKKEQKKQDKAFNRKYFKPWKISKLSIEKKDFGWEIRFVKRNRIYRENGSIISSDVSNKWIKNANYRVANTAKAKAITIKRTNVRALPTSYAYYLNPKKTGEGFPFDYNQNSALHINIPLYVSHYSRDKKWAFVQASYSFGWVKTSDIAIVNEDFIYAFKNNNYAMIIRDNLRLYDENRKSVSIVKVGALFPISSDNKYYLLAKRKSNGKATLHKTKVLNPRVIAKKPLPFTPKNVADLAREFYGEPYGWGGGYECRDCSATTRDFMGVFGIFLRRNSSKQAKDGKSIRIKGLGKKRKKQTIIKNAKPFRSLLYVPGHIVLYLGEFKGEPVVMHTYWGIRKKNGSKLVTARTIITSTEPGKERKDVKESSKLINTLRTIVNF